MREARYDAIGAGYSATRREDPRIAALIRDALGAAMTVVNVGAGAGSYEPRDREVIPIEPSEVMIAQRDPSLPPAVRACRGVHIFDQAARSYSWSTPPRRLRRRSSGMPAVSMDG